ncbi:7755_t:CDS:2, partial [Paraglomus occultum]
GSELLKNHFPNVPIYNGFAFEGLANRDSLAYVDTYGLAPIENKRAIFRGTLRYKGFSDLMYSFVNIGLLDSGEMTRQIDNWTDFLDYLLFDKSNVNNPNNESRIDAIADKIKLSKDHEMLENVIDALTWLSLFPKSSSNTQVPSFPNVKTPIDAFCFLLQNKLAYSEGETDLVVLHHEFGVKNKQGLEEIRTSTLVEYGTPGGYTAMAKAVGLPAAMAVEMILRDKVKECGVLSPTSPYIYKTILENLYSQGVRIIENTSIKGMASSLSWSGSGIWER